MVSKHENTLGTDLLNAVNEILHPRSLVARIFLFLITGWLNQFPWIALYTGYLKKIYMENYYIVHWRFLNHVDGVSIKINSRMWAGIHNKS